MNKAGAITLARSIRMSSLASTVFAIYDHVLTFEAEVEYVWSKPWSISKMFYLWTRYLGDTCLICSSIILIHSRLKLTRELCVVLIPFPTISVKILTLVGFARMRLSCTMFIRFQGCSSAILVWTIQIILQCRIYAMYNRSRVVMVPLVGTFVVTSLLSCGLLMSALINVEVTSEPAPDFHFCALVTFPEYAGGWLIPSVVFETILFSLAARTLVKEFREIRVVRAKGLLKILVRDSFIYFFISLSTYLAVAVTFLVAPKHFEIPGSFAYAGTTIMGSRLVLNLREAYYRPYSAAVPNPTLWGHSNWSIVGQEAQVVEEEEEEEVVVERRSHHSSKRPHMGDMDVEAIELVPIPSPPGPSRCHEPLWMVEEEGKGGSSSMKT